jgi:hypothetical protein
LRNPSDYPNPGSPETGNLTDLALVALFSGVVFACAHLQAFTNPYVVNDDVRQQIYWMQQWLDPQLFRGDLLSDYARHYVPVGVKALYWLATRFMGPIWFSKVLTGFLFVFLGLCLYQIGFRLADRRLGWTTVCVYWLMPFFLENMSGSMARAFAAPLLALFWLCWLTRRPWGMGLALLLQGLFIPYIFPVAAGAAILAWLAGRTGHGGPPPFPARPSHWVLLGAAEAQVVLMEFQFTAGGFGPLVSAADMAHRPEFFATGRYPILPVPSLLWQLVSPWEFIAPFRDGGTVAGIIGCVLILGLAAVGARRVDWQALKPRLASAEYLGLASVLLYYLAYLLLLKLFIPDRYLIYTLNLCYCLALALCLKAALRVERWPQKLLVLGLILAAGLGAWRLQGVGLKDYSAYRPLYAALAQTPKDAIIAGHPNLLDNVPTFTQRQAFVTYKLAHVWSKGLWQKVRPRLDELFAAYYAADPEQVIAFCRKYHISFLVVDDRHFSPAFLAGGWFLFPYEQAHRPGTPPGLAERNYGPFFAPFDEEIRQLVKGRQEFALLASPRFQPLMLDKHIRLLDMRPFLTPKP